MSDLNNCSFTGRLGADPEPRVTQAGLSVCTFSLSNKDAYKKDVTHWIKVTTFGKQADFVAQWLQRGSGVSVTGRLVSSKYTDKSGQERTGWEIVADRVGFNGPRADAQGENVPAEYSRPHQQPQQQQQQGWGQAPQQQQQQAPQQQQSWGNGGGWNNG